ncbi:uncharacterized protein DS421_19g644980 [Arachis hypogaea]|uniref:Uncharacterized protein n=1 Tax=Arachis hypogaea TaxID=3818 RepID=A0A6B9V6D8_ARAHY|nr:uncharacterized protein DS421_19g644980 [Arachis hypogaea]
MSLIYLCDMCLHQKAESIKEKIFWFTRRLKGNGFVPLKLLKEMDKFVHACSFLS